MTLGYVFHHAEVPWPDAGAGFFDAGMPALLAMTGLALLLGIHMVMAIGGGDMPVVVSLLNSYSGWAAAAAGFMLSNDLLIVTGALVGSSGAILSYIMCKAMNRSIWNVILGGFGAEAGAKPAPGAAPAGKVTETNVERGRRAGCWPRATSIIVPGYGMAVAQAQHAGEGDLVAADREGRHAAATRSTRSRAGCPGHMNVLLAEANVSYDIVKEMDEINPDFPQTEVVMVIGANDIVNPSAETDTSSPIYGMPVLQVWKAGKVVMLKRGMSAGYAGVDNPLVYNDNTAMLFGDAAERAEAARRAARRLKPRDSGAPGEPPIQLRPQAVELGAGAGGGRMARTWARKRWNAATRFVAGRPERLEAQTPARPCFRLRRDSRVRAPPRGSTARLAGAVRGPCSARPRFARARGSDAGVGVDGRRRRRRS